MLFMEENLIKMKFIAICNYINRNINKTHIPIFVTFMFREFSHIFATKTADMKLDRIVSSPVDRVATKRKKV